MKYIICFLIFCLSGCGLQTNNYNSDLQSSGRWVVWSEKPSAIWEDAFVTGNGSHGTMVLGQPGDERIICVHEESVDGIIIKRRYLSLLTFFRKLADL